jgi:predicted nucleic acid-binding protein
MIVVDASVMIDLLLARPPHAAAIAARLHGEAIAAPHLLDVEIGQVLRRFVRRREVSAPRAAGALEDLAALPIERHPHTQLLQQAFSLRDSATFYDAAYLALAAALRVPFLTRDRALARVRWSLATVEWIG